MAARKRYQKPKGKRLGILEKDKIAEMTAQGWTSTAIARELNCSKATVYAKQNSPYVRAKIKEQLNKLGLYSPIVTVDEITYYRETAITQLLAMTKDSNIDARDRIAAAKTLLDYSGPTLPKETNKTRGGFQPLPNSPEDDPDDAYDSELNLEGVKRSIFELKRTKKENMEYGAEDEDEDYNPYEDEYKEEEEEEEEEDEEEDEEDT